MQKNVLQIFFYHQSIDVEEINVLDQFLWYFCLDKNIVSKKFGRKKTFISILSSWQYAAKLIFFPNFIQSHIWMWIWFAYINISSIERWFYFVLSKKKIVSPIVYYYSTHCIRSISLKMLFVVSWRFLCSIADYSRKQKKFWIGINFFLYTGWDQLFESVCVCVYVLICLSCDSSFFQNFFFIFAIFLYLACVFTHFYSFFFLFCSSMIDC